jgi:hypothetical protein
MISKVNMELSQVYYGIYHPDVPVYFEDIYCTKNLQHEIAKSLSMFTHPCFLANLR